MIITWSSSWHGSIGLTPASKLLVQELNFETWRFPCASATWSPNGGRSTVHSWNSLTIWQKQKVFGVWIASCHDKFWTPKIVQRKTHDLRLKRMSRATGCWFHTARFWKASSIWDRYLKMTSCSSRQIGSPQIRGFTSATRHVNRSPQSTGSCATTSYPLRSRQWWNTSLAFSGCVKIFGQGWLSRRARCCRSSVGLEETWIPCRSCHDPENPQTMEMKQPK